MSIAGQYCIMKYRIFTLGCKVNQYDSMEIGRKMTAAGFTSAKRNADLAIINTCSVTQAAIRKNRRIISKAKAENPGAKIIVMGCWPQVYGKNAVDADIVWGVGELGGLMKRIFNPQFLISNIIPNSESQITITGKISNRQPRKSRYFLKVQDGCEQYCAYCVIPYARGKPASRPVADVLREAKEAIKAGYPEIVLCGIHLGLYGKDLIQGRKLKSQKQPPKIKISPKPDLAFLLKEIVYLSGLGRIRLSSIEVNEVTDELIGLMAENRKICRHLHIPLQSGSDKILESMNRPYTRSQFADRIRKIRKSMPDIAVTTDLIAGFPGETEKEHAETMEFIKKMRFSRLHVFPFSAHEKTPASNFKGRVADTAVKERARELRELGNKLEKSFIASFKGREAQAVLEGQKGGTLKAKTEYYFDIALSDKQMEKYRRSDQARKRILKIKIET